MAIVSIHNKPKRIGSKKTFGELKVGDTYWAYLKSSGDIKKRTILKIENYNVQNLYIVKIGGPVVKDVEWIDVYYGITEGDRNVVYKGSSITINADASLIYATTKEELEEAIKYYS